MARALMTMATDQDGGRAETSVKEAVGSGEATLTQCPHCAWGLAGRAVARKGAVSGLSHTAG